jgi:prepilin-type N-terminal cleavage/methylation domain-containing protein
MKITNTPHLTPQRRQSGFTLLELVVVVAIIATIGGALLVAYDGLDARASKAQATFNLAAIDKGVRTFKVVSGAYPNNLDSVVVAGTTLTSADVASAGGFMNSLHSNMEGVDGDTATADGKLAFYTLTANAALALQNAGISNLRAPTTTNTSGLSIPNRALDDPSRGLGTNVTVAAGLVVPIVESLNFGANTSGGIQRLRDISGLATNIGHVVVALAVGNNATIVSDATGANSANFAEAPFYTDVAKNEYGRFFALFHVGDDNNTDGDIDDSGETFSRARFIGVIDSKGDWLDEEYAEATGQKL